MKKICVITGTRAEYGLLKPLIQKINNDECLELQLVVTGMHLSPEFGLTYKEIEQDGFEITERNEMLLSSDTPNGITKSIGLGIIGFADIFTRLTPDMIVILGDRYEALAAATAAMIHRVPIAHIHGGEVTEGVIDESIRHAITKMSMLHFTSTETYRNRVIQLGEQPDRVFCVGALGVENIKTQKLMNKKELEDSICFKLDKPYIMVTFHPVTLENNTAKEQFENLLSVLNRMQEYQIIFTKANSDTDGRTINQRIDEYVSNNKKRAVAFISLGMVRYLSALQYCEMVVGNSSSGILEVPSFHIPTVNIGDRQKGRVKGKSIIDCGSTQKEILNAIHTAQGMNRDRVLQNEQNPYEGEKTSETILNSMKYHLQSGIDIKKHFFDIEWKG